MDNPKNSQPTAPRVIAMSDFPPINVIPGSTFKEGEPREMYSDPDDVQSMIRLLLYANELEIEGLVASAGSLANIARKKNILDVLDVYERVQPNLAKRDPRYPMADALRAVTWQGLDGAWGTPYFGRPGLPLDELIGEEKDTEASEAIIRVVDKPDPRPVWVCVWGGSCEVAQAIWKVQHTRNQSGPFDFDTLRYSICTPCIDKPNCYSQRPIKLNPNGNEYARTKLQTRLVYSKPNCSTHALSC